MKNTYSKHLLALLFFLLPVGIVMPATALTTVKEISFSKFLPAKTETPETKRGDLSSGALFETELSLASGLLTIKDIKGTTNNVIVHTVNGGALRITNHDNLLGGAVPTDLQIDGANTDSVNENRLVGAVVGVLTTTDTSTVDSHSYSLVSGAGDTDNASFQISGDKLLTNAVFDFETKSSYSIRVRSTDSDSQSYEEALTITVNDITNETNTSTQTLWNLNTAGDYTASSTLAIDLSTGIGQLTTGSFTADNIEATTDESRHSSVADFNADGHLDIYVSNFGQ